MKGFYRLLNYEFQTMLRSIGLICLGILIIPLFLLHSAIKGKTTLYSVHERFEDIYIASGCGIVFLVFGAILLALFVKSLYANYWGSKSIYTLLTLPVKREAVYFGKLFTFAISALLFLAVQFVSAAAGYALIFARVKMVGDGQFVMNNGFFLAFLRSPFLRLLLPLSPYELVSSFSLLVVLLTGLYYAVLCERSKRYWGFINIAAALWMAISMFSYRLERPIYYISAERLYLYSGILLLLSGFFMWHSMKLIKKGAIA